MKLSTLLQPHLIQCGLKAKTKEEALAELARLLVASAPDLTEKELLAALAEREKLGPFSMGKAIAFPHARTEKVKDFTIVLGTAPQGIDFRAPDNLKVRILVLFAIPKKHSNLYLHTLAAFLNFFAVEANVQKVLEAKTAPELIATLDTLAARARDLAPGVPSAPGAVPSVTAQTPLARAMESLQAARQEALPVVDADGNLVGEITSAGILQLGLRDHVLGLSAPAVLAADGSVERALRQHADTPIGSLAGLVAAGGYRTVQEDETPLEMAACVVHSGGGHAYVLRGTRLVGRVSAGELLRRLGAPRLPQEAGR